jgi:glucosyl-3-phosphoglycerate synthase
LRGELDPAIAGQGDRQQAVTFHPRHRLGDRRHSLIETLSDAGAQRNNALFLELEHSAQIHLCAVDQVVAVVHLTIVLPAGHKRSCTVREVRDRLSPGLADRVELDRGDAHRVDDWFAAHTSAIDDWTLDSVRATKGAHRISVVLPALDEEATVGEIVATIRADLAGGPGDLVDEVLVVDSGSKDSTAAIAAANGARVVKLSDVLPELAPRRGKGEAMWRGVAATDADLIVFVDADLKSFDSRFGVALLGPLLANPATQFVKAAYDRPSTDPAVPSNGGGRVTELMARPLISAFWPELSGVLQPLAGEYAARADLLRTLPFRCGYGVDLGLLLDVYRAAGLDAIAQVDLRRRWHRHSDLPSLGRMAAEVMHTALDRLTDEGRLPASLDPATLLWQPDRVEGGVRTARHVIDTAERPPLRDVARLLDQANDHSATK